MEFSPTSSSYPAQSHVAARAGFGDEWEKTHLSWENHMKCISSNATSLILPKQTDLQPQQTDSSCHFTYGIHTHKIFRIVKYEYFCIAFHDTLVA